MFVTKFCDLCRIDGFDHQFFWCLWPLWRLWPNFATFVTIATFEKILTFVTSLVRAQTLHISQPSWFVQKSQWFWLQTATMWWFGLGNFAMFVVKFSTFVKLPWLWPNFAKIVTNCDEFDLSRGETWRESNRAAFRGATEVLVQFNS